MRGQRAEGRAQKKQGFAALSFLPSALLPSALPEFYAP